ncbi:MAG: hypothetical protein AB7O96_13375 [Pseudobdellovibrionaceae bacterium]
MSQIFTAETAISSSELTTELSRLTTDLKKSEDALSELAKKEESLSSWLTSFSGVRKFLTQVRDSSVSEYTSKYGPLASTIQARLRSVFGFGEISLSSSEGKIAVTVERSEKQLRPIDYFSESQKQILVLSIFLASAITQNWSSFSPIFLDDPVTHFDDLNAYAFLDLISGMLQSEKGRRQFIISTCEEKLFQLMRQKFYGYGKRVLIYEFLAIGKNGPEWRQIENGRTSVEVH